MNDEELKKIKKKQDSIAILYIELSKTLGKNEKIKSIEYYEKMSLLPEYSSKYGFELDALIVRKEVINDKKEKIIMYEIYDDQNNNVGKVEEGKIHFNPTYIERIRKSSKDNYLSDKLVELDGKLEYNDLVERNKDKSLQMSEEQIISYIKEEKQEILKAQSSEARTDRIAKEKGIPVNSIVFVRNDSFLYKNHPELERNMFFYRDENGVVRAEYIDEKGNIKESEYIDNSKSYMRKVVSMGKDGENIEEEMPYQFMTSSIKSKGSNVREIGFSVNINMGYLEIDEARLGANGEWTSHEIEMQGRKYNSQQINEQTDLRYKSSNPDEISNGYERVKDTGFAEDGIQLDELDPEVIISRLIDEGYQRDEAIDIINYMIGEEQLTEEKAKERVNEKIKERREDEREIDDDERIMF